MASLHTRTLVSLLTDMTADPALLATALARQSVADALAKVVNGLAAAVADLDDRIYPPVSARTRVGADRRWRAAATRLDRAVGHAQYAAELLDAVAARCRRVILDAEVVDYHGSLTAHHGRYTVDGPCICEGCDDFGLSLHLRSVRGRHALTCVNPHSVSPTPAADTPALVSARRARHLLTTMIAALPAPLDASDALHHARSLAVVTARTRTVVAGWHDRFAHVFNPRAWCFDTDGGWPWEQTRRVVDALERSAATLPHAGAELRRAIAVLAEIEADPQPGRQSGRRAA